MSTVKSSKRINARILVCLSFYSYTFQGTKPGTVLPTVSYVFFHQLTIKTVPSRHGPT